MTKRILSLFLAVLAVFSLCATAAAVPAPDRLTVEYAAEAARSIALTTNHTLCLREDGTVAETECKEELAFTDYCGGDVSDWTDIVALAAGPGKKAGLRGDGTVVFTGERVVFNEKEIVQDTSDWTDIVSITAGLNCVAGVRSDGTVAIVGNNFVGACEVSDWTDIVAVSAGYYNTVGLRADGTVVSTQIVADDSYVQYFDNDQEQVRWLFDKGQCDVSGWTGIVAISASETYTAGLRRDGTVVLTDCELDVSDWTDIVAIAAGSDHIVGLHSDGTVVADGNNEEGQCDVEDWTDIVAITACAGNTTGLRRDGTVITLGNDLFGACSTKGMTGIRVPEGAPDLKAGSSPAYLPVDGDAQLRFAYTAYRRLLRAEREDIDSYGQYRSVALTDIAGDEIPELIYMRPERDSLVTLHIATFRDGELTWLYSDDSTYWDGQVGGGFARCLFKVAGDSALYAYLRPPFETEGHIGFSRFVETADGTLKRTPVCMENYFISHDGGYNESVTYLVDGTKGTEQDYLERAEEIGSSVTEVFQSNMGSWEDEGLPGRADLQSLCSAMTCEEAIAYLRDLAAGEAAQGENAAAPSGRTTVDVAALPDSLNAFLKQFIDWYGIAGDYASDSYYDCEHAADGSSNIMAGIVNCVTPSIVDFSLYPGVMPEEYMSLDDWYVVYDGPTADWVARNIFNVSDGDLDTLVRQAEAQGRFRLDGMDDGSYQYISPIIGGIGDTGTEVRLSSAEFDGQKYYVVYDLYQVWFTTDGKDEYLSSYYAELEYKDIDGQSYWSMYRNTADIPPEAEASADGWLGRWYAETGEYLDIRSVSDTGISMVFHIIIENGEFMDSPYELEFDNGARTVASEMGGPMDHGSWEYTFILGDGYITVQSRYPDQIFTKDGGASYSGTITVTADDVNIRSGPGTYYARLGEADRGARFTAAGRTGGWYQIDYYGTAAYIIEDYVTEGDDYSVVPDSGTLTVTANDVNIRTGPGTGYESIGKVSYGVPLAMTGKIGNWYQIDYNGTTAYIIEDDVVRS